MSRPSHSDCLFLHIPRWKQGRREIMILPLGLPALANLIADQTEIEPTLLHLGIEQEVQPSFSLRSFLSAHPPRLLLVTLHWYLQTQPVIDWTRRIRSWFPETRIVLGGLTASVFAKSILETLPHVDAVVRGDGEEPSLALARACIQHGNKMDRAFERVPNLMWRDGSGTVRENPLRYQLDEEDSARLKHGSLKRLRHRKAYLQRALYADFSEGAHEVGYANAAYLNAGRGCSVSCANCGGAASSQTLTCGRQGILLYPLPKLVRDVREAVGEGAEVLRMSFDPPAARQTLCSWFNAIRGMGIRRLVFDLWHLPSHKLLDTLARTFEKSTLILSPECGSEDVRKRVRGFPFSNGSLLQSIRDIEARGLDAHCFFSAGLPTETREDLDHTLTLIHRIRSETRAGISVCPMVADPGSPLFRAPEAFGATLTRRSLRDFYEEKGIPNGPGYETQHFSEQDILVACDRLLQAAGLPPTYAATMETPSPSSTQPPAPVPKPRNSNQLTVLLVGSFRSLVPEGREGPLGSQGGFVDNLAPTPYSLANGYLKAFAEASPEVRERYEIHLLDFAEPLEMEDEREEVLLGDQEIDQLLSYAPHIIGFSAYCWNLDTILHAAREIKKRSPSPRILIGGRATESDACDLMASCPAIDAVIVGEGELAFREILHRGSFDGIPGVFTRVDGTVRCGGPAQSLQDLDEIPSPFLSGILTPTNNAVMLELSRGCLHACGYCTWNSDKTLRFFSSERIEKEVSWAVSQGHRHITLNDSAINYDTSQLEAFVQAIHSADPTGQIHFTYNLRHDILTQKQIRLLSDLKTHMALVGVETLSEQGMPTVDRDRVDTRALHSNLHELSRAVRPPVASIVLGLPDENEEQFLETLDTLLSWTEAGHDGIRVVGTVLVSLLQVYPGSKLWQRRYELGLCFRESGIPYLIESPSWPKEALARCKREIIRRIARNPETLKAAEALVLMTMGEGMSIWFSPRILRIMLQDWPEGAEHEGWTMEAVGVMRDTRQGVLLRFRRRDGGRVRVRLTFDDASKDEGQGRYRIGLHTLPGAVVPQESLLRLAKMVRAVVRRGEHRAAAHIREQQRRLDQDPT